MPKGFWPLLWIPSEVRFGPAPTGTFKGRPASCEVLATENGTPGVPLSRNSVVAAPISTAGTLDCKPTG